MAPLCRPRWPPVRAAAPRGRVYFWSSPNFSCSEPPPDTDVSALADSYITVTPLQFDLTQRTLLQAMNGWSWELEKNGAAEQFRS